MSAQRSEAIFMLRIKHSSTVNECSVEWHSCNKAPLLYSALLNTLGERKHTGAPGSLCVQLRRLTHGTYTWQLSAHKQTADVLQKRRRQLTADLTLQCVEEADRTHENFSYPLLFAGKASSDTR